MKRYSSAPCLEDVGSDAKRTKRIEQYADPNTKEYLQLALARVLELQRKVKEGTYVAETGNGSNNGDADNEEDLTKEILAKVFQDLPGTPDTVAKIIDRETRWSDHHMDAIHSKRIQLLGFDTCRRMALEFMKTIVRESRNRSLYVAELDDSQFQQNRSLYSRDEMLKTDLHERESDAQEIRARMLRSLDLHLAVKQRDYTAKLMRSAI